MDTLNITNGDIVLEFIYLLSALFFVWGLKLLSSPDSARRGNIWAATGMLMAMIATLVLHRNGEGNAIRGANIAIILGAIAFGGDHRGSDCPPR
jgi:NAD(P) transhydrogenase subunit beta